MKSSIAVKERSNMFTIPKKIIDRYSKSIPKFTKVLTTAKDRDVNESDTVAIITDI